VVSQIEFDKMVQDYNSDFTLLLTRASKRHYDCLITSWFVLKDFYDVINMIFERSDLKYKEIPYPFTFRGNDVFLSKLGFDQAQMRNIYEFLDITKETYGKEFEQCIEEGSIAMCAQIKGS
jgi:hypothetical protein